jgi:hypothetical protein
MHKKVVLIFFFLSFVPTAIVAQNLGFGGGFILFREAKTKEPVLIINDSLVYKGLVPSQIPFKHTQYPDKLQEYNFFNIEDKTYLVHKGCGPVLEFRNDSIVKINNAYLQRNQFRAVQFVYNKEIYFFGGYGLFTTKNILTKYNFKTRDWIEVQTYGEKVQEPRTAAFSYRKGDDLYVFGGVTSDVNNVPDVKPLDDNVWRLHLPTMRWNCVGKYDPSSIKIEPEEVIHDSGKLYFCSKNFSEIDYYANKRYTYECNYFPKVLSSYIEGKTIIGVYQVGPKIFFHVGDISEFKGKLKSTAVFISPLEDTINPFMVPMSISLLLLVVMIVPFRKKLKEIVKPFKGITYNQQKQIFLFKGRPITLFEEQEKKVLFYLFDHQNQFVSLNELNQLFENNGGAETVSATVKRREQAVNGLLAKVSKITGMDEKELAIERKNAEDKRIKDIMLLPNLLKLK